jgi:hypothetical protein
VTPKKSARPAASLTPVKQESQRPSIKEEPPPFDEETDGHIAGAGAASERPIGNPSPSGDPMKVKQIAADFAEMEASSEHTAGDALSSVSASAASDVSEDLESALPADAAALTSAALDDAMPGTPATDPLDRAPSGSYGSGSSGDSGARATASAPAATASAPAAAAALEFAPEARMATGCSTDKVGVCGVELSPSNRALCHMCKAKILKQEIRFMYWHSTKKPPGYIHTQCIVSLPLSATELKAHLSALIAAAPILKQAVSDAMVALDARAF